MKGHFVGADADGAVAEVALPLRLEVEAPGAAGGHAEAEGDASARFDADQAVDAWTSEADRCPLRAARHREDQVERASSRRRDDDRSAWGEPAVGEATRCEQLQARRSGRTVEIEH